MTTRILNAEHTREFADKISMNIFKSPDECRDEMSKLSYLSEEMDLEEAKKKIEVGEFFCCMAE